VNNRVKLLLLWMLLALPVVMAGGVIGKMIGRGFPALIIITMFVFVFLLVLALYFFFFQR
jgi:hypothetical protein